MHLLQPTKTTFCSSKFQSSMILYLSALMIYWLPIILYMHTVVMTTVGLCLMMNITAKRNQIKIKYKKNLIILHQTFLIIYLERVYVYRRSHTPLKPISTMYTHLHCSVSMMLRSAQKSKQYSFHNACKRIAKEKPYNLTSDISDNLS